MIEIGLEEEAIEHAMSRSLCRLRLVEGRVRQRAFDWHLYNLLRKSMEPALIATVVENWVRLSDKKESGLGGVWWGSCGSMWQWRGRQRSAQRLALRWVQGGMIPSEKLYRLLLRLSRSFWIRFSPSTIFTRKQLRDGMYNNELLLPTFFLLHKLLMKSLYDVSRECHFCVPGA
jgi:hypothetical protein